MKVLAVLSLVSVAFAGVNVLQARNCAGNNCNRAITGTRSGLRATSLRSSDCASFLLTVVTPSPVTSTTWVDSTTTSVSGTAPASAVTVTATALPTYATACSSAAAYASACSCYGLTGSVSTAAVPTVTVTSTYEYCDL